MKKFYFLIIVACALFLIVYSCNKEKDLTENIKSFDSEQLVYDYNRSLSDIFGVAIPKIKKAFTATGTITSQIARSSTGSRYLAMIFTETVNGTNSIQLDFGLNSDLEFPKNISNSEITFLGNQLIIQDFDNESVYNFFVPTYNEPQNKVPNMNFIEGSFMRIKSTPNFPFTARNSNECECECKTCFPPGQCSQASCSCNCPSGDACSVQCYNGFQATCEKRCADEL